MCMLAVVIFQVTFQPNGLGYSVLGIWIGLESSGSKPSRVIFLKIVAGHGVEKRKGSF